MNIPDFSNGITKAFGYTAPEVIESAQVYVEVEGELKPVKQVFKSADDNNDICLVIQV